MTSKVSFRLVDKSREFSTCGFHLPQITALSHDAVVAQRDALKSAIATASLCNFANTKLTHSDDPDIPSVPTSNFAQRETGLQVSYVDNGDPLKSYHTTIPGPDLAVYAQANTDEIDITSGPGQTLANAVETNCVAPSTGNAITVVRMRIVGRRN